MFIQIPSLYKTVRLTCIPLHRPIYGKTIEILATRFCLVVHSVEKDKNCSVTIYIYTSDEKLFEYIHVLREQTTCI